MPQCPVCDKDIRKETLKRTYLSSYNETRCSLYHCPNCHLEFWEPRRILRGYYEDAENPAYALIHCGLRGLQNWHKPFFEKFPLRKGRLLDVGCGDGSFLAHARRTGFDVYGIDLDRKSVEAAREKLGMKDVYPFSLADSIGFAEERGLKFDVVTFFEVLEHQDNPRSFLSDIKGLLSPGGYIAGSVPNRNRFLVDVERRSGVVDFPPHHFLWFSRGDLSFFFRKMGFHEEIYTTFWSLREMSDILQIFFSGSFLRKAREKTLKTFVREAQPSRPVSAKILMAWSIIKRLSEYPLYPLAFFLTRFSGREGRNIYFQARLEQ